MNDSRDNPPGTMPGNPGGTAGGTVIIPMPGGKPQTQAPASPSPLQPAAPGAPVNPVPLGPAGIPGVAPVTPDPAQELPRITGNYSQNPVINHATTLLAVMGKLRGMLAHDDPAGLQRQLGAELSNFENRCQQSGLAAEQIIAARYLLCTALDEAVMNTPWGVSSGWSQRSLLSAFHNETFGGEKFFQILDRLQQEPERQIDLLELVYLLISLGFEGKYKLDPRGKDQLETIRENLYRKIEQLRGAYEVELSPHWQSHAQGKGGMISFVPLWVVASCFLAILLLAYGGARAWLDHNTKPAAAHLEQLNAEILEDSPN